MTVILSLRACDCELILRVLLEYVKSERWRGKEDFYTMLWVAEEIARQKEKAEAAE